jgi:ubiquinol-cytochrome c reductase cytochrome b subunit
LWGGFGVAAPTLNRFYTLHFLLPFVVLGMVVLHLSYLHNEGSTEPGLGNHGSDNTNFGSYYILKDLLGLLLFGMVFCLFLIFAPNALNHPDNYVPANPMQTPAHIVPE